MGEVKAFFELLEETSSLRKLGRGGLETGEITDAGISMERIAGLAKTADIKNLSEFFGVSETFFEVRSAEAHAQQLRGLEAAEQESFFTGLSQVSAKEKNIKDVLKLSAAELGDGASVTEKAAAQEKLAEGQAKLAKMYGLDKAKLEKIAEGGGEVTEAAKAKITKINQLLYGEGVEASRTVKLSEITELENVVGKEGLNESNLGKIKQEAFGSGSKGLVDNIETLEKLKTISGKELTGDSIKSFKNDFKIPKKTTDLSTLNTQLGELIEEGERFGNNYTLLREYFKLKYWPNKFSKILEELQANGKIIGEEGLAAKVVEMEKKVWRLRWRIGKGTGALLLGGVGTKFYFDATRKECDPGLCPREDECQEVPAYELAGDCGKYISLYKSRKEPDSLPPAFKDWMGKESSSQCNYGPCSDTTEENCYLKGHPGFPTNGRECTDTDDPACPKSDNKVLGVNKNRYSWPYAIEDCSECPSGVGELSWYNTPNAINCQLNEWGTTAWTAISDALLAVCAYFLEGIIVFALLCGLGILYRNSIKQVWEKIPSMPKFLRFFFYTFIFIWVACFLALVTVYVIAVYRLPDSSLCSTELFGNINNKCSSPPQEAKDLSEWCNGEVSCHYDEENQICITQINLVSGIVYGFLFGYKFWPGLAILSGILILITPIILGVRALSRWRGSGNRQRRGLQLEMQTFSNTSSSQSNTAQSQGGGGSLPDTNKKQCLGLIVLILLIIFNFLRKQKDKINSYQRNMNEFIQKKTNKINATKTKSTKTTISPNILNENKFKTVIGGQYVSI